MRITGIILAGGFGTRMNSNTPKQYMEMCGKPVLYYAIKEFEESDVNDIILVVQKDYREYCVHELIEKYNFKKIKNIAESGKERYDSVYNGVKLAPQSDYIMIHDGVRAFVTTSMINNMIEEVKKNRACIAAVPVKDTIKMADINQMVDHTINRNLLWQVQTPQIFETEILEQAYTGFQEDNNKSITDDSMLVELYTDVKVKICMGDYDNIKITTPEDLITGEGIISRRNMSHNDAK